LDQDQQKCQMTDLSCPKHYYARPSSSNDPAPARVREANGPTMVSIADKRELRQAYLESSKSAAIVEPSKKRTCKEAPTSYLNIHANNSRSQERRTQQSVAVMIKSTNVDENQRNMCGVRKSDILISRHHFDLSKKGKVASTAAGLVDIVDVTAKNEQSLLYALGPETGRIFMELKSNPSVSVNLHYTDDDDFKTPAQAMKDSRKRPRTLHPSTVHQRREAESEPANLDEL